MSSNIKREKEKLTLLERAATGKQSTVVNCFPITAQPQEYFISSPLSSVQRFITQFKSRLKTYFTSMKCRKFIYILSVFSDL